MTSVVSGDDLRVGVSFDASPDRSVVLGLEDGNEDDGVGDGVRKFGANDGSTVESSITWDGTSGGCSIGPDFGLLRAGDPLIRCSCRSLSLSVAPVSLGEMSMQTQTVCKFLSGVIDCALQQIRGKIRALSRNAGARITKVSCLRNAGFLPSGDSGTVHFAAAELALRGPCEKRVKHLRLRFFRAPHTRRLRQRALSQIRYRYSFPLSHSRATRVHVQ